MLSLGQMVVFSTFIACLPVPQHTEDKGWEKLGKGVGRGASKIVDIGNSVADLVKGGSKIDHDKLIDLLKQSSKTRYGAARAFQSLVEEPLNQLDTSIRILKKTAKDSSPLILKAQKAVRANINKEIAAARRAAEKHNAVIEAIAAHNKKVAHDGFFYTKKARTNYQQNKIDLNMVRVSLKSNKIDEWSVILKEKHPDQFEMLKTIPLEISPSMNMKKIGKEVIIPSAGVTTVGGASIHLLKDYLEKKLDTRE